MAKQLEITREASDLVVTVRWQTGAAATLVLIFGIVIFVGASIVVGSGKQEAAFGIFVGSMITYFGLALLINKTTLRANTRRVEISRGPLLTFRKRREELSAYDLDQLYLKRSNASSSSGKGSNRKVTHYYHLAAKLKNGEEKLLLRNYANRALITDAEAALEAHLGIEDQVVPVEPSGGQPSAEQLAVLEKYMPEGMKNTLKNAANAHHAELHRERNAGKPGYQAYGEHPDDTWYDTSAPGSSSGDSSDDYVPNPYDAPATRDRAPEATGPAAGDLRKSLRGIFDGDDRPHAELPPADNPKELAVQALGGTATFRDRPVRLVGDDIAKYENGDVGRRISLTYVEDTEPPTQVYAHYNKGEWSYGEERQLDTDELAALGFDDQGEAAPLSLRNGDDRYYPGEEFTGKLTDGRPVQQYTYVTTRDSTRFRAVRVGKGDWRVYVQEVV